MTLKTNEIKTVLIYVLILNWAVAAAKVIAGLMFGVMSMVADGFHSITDGARNIVGWVGLTAASKPIDEEHPYGHKKSETFTALGISMLLLLVCFEIFKSAIGRIMHPKIPIADPVTFIVMAITMAVNIFVTIYEYRKGKELKSDILISDSLHTRSDILASTAVIVSLVSIRMGWIIVDAIASLVIVLFILISALNIFRRVFDVLVDREAIDRKKIEEIVLARPEIMVCHKIRTRGREDDIHVDLHISVDSSMSVTESHCLSHNLQEDIKRKVPGVTDVIIHIEPH